MKLGVDTSVLVSAVHANHPLHVPSASWLDDAFSAHEIVVAHHSVIEAFAVLTRLPAKYRLSPSEAEMVIHGTLHGNVRIAPFDSGSVWQALDFVAAAPAAGGAAYDAFIIHLLATAGVERIVTYNVREFRRLTDDVAVSEPSEV